MDHRRAAGKIAAPRFCSLPRDASSCRHTASAPAMHHDLARVGGGQIMGSLVCDPIPFLFAKPLRRHGDILPPDGCRALLPEV